MEYRDYSDNELMYLIGEENEIAKDIVYEKYKYLIESSFKKYKRMGHILGLEESDLYQEALLGFSDALSHYDDNQNAKLSTFITLCVERRLQVAVIKAGRLKHRLFNESLSLEQVYSGTESPLMDLISDDNKNNPLDNLMDEEQFRLLNEQIKDTLSASEYEVYGLMLNGFTYTEIAEILGKSVKSIDNTMTRTKRKIRQILEER